MTAPVVDNVLELIGHTPMVRVRSAELEGTGRIWAKCEHFNPGGSVKDRICLAMIQQAEKDGTLKPGMTVVEPTSGNTGIGLALTCAVKGYHLILTMPESMSLERRALLQAYGAEIVLTPAEEVMIGAIDAAREIVRTQGAFMPQQFDNPANPAIHHATTARELLAAMDGEPIHALVAAVGTGGTVSGVGLALKTHDRAIRVIAVEPETSPVLTGGEPGPSKIQGIGAGFVPKNYHAEIVDEVLHVADRDAWNAKVRMANSDGLLVGISAGANVVAARRVAEELGPRHNVVTILCDTGERYFSLGEYFD